MKKPETPDASRNQIKKKEATDISIESLAKYTLDQKHPGSKLDFNKQVIRIGGYANFMLLKYSNENKLIRVYLVSAGHAPIDKSDQPYPRDFMTFFRKHKTDPPENYYFFRIAMDQNDQPNDSKLFTMPHEFNDSATGC